MEDELTDEQWMTIQPLLPRQTGPGKPRADDRETLFRWGQKASWWPVPL